MSVFGLVMLIPYFTAYLIHYYYILKTKYDCQKPTVDLESTSKNTLIK